MAYPYAGYNRPFRQPRFAAFEPKAQFAQPELGDLAGVKSQGLDPQQRQDFAARQTRLDEQQQLEAFQRRPAHPGEQPALDAQQPNEAQQALGTAQQGVSAVQKIPGLIRTARAGAKTIADMLGNDLTAARPEDAEAAFQAQRAGERSPGLADLVGNGSGAVSAPTGAILDIPQGATGPSEFPATRGVPAPAPTSALGGADVAGDFVGDLPLDQAGTAASTAAEAGLGLGDIAGPALQALPWLGAALKAAGIIAGQGSGEEKAVGVGGTALQAALPGLLNSLPGAAAANAAALADAAAGIGGAVGGAAAGAGEAGAAAGVAAAPALSVATTFAAPVAMGVAFAIDHLLDMMADVPHGVREDLDFNKLSGEASSYADTLRYARNPEELYAMIKQREPVQFGGAENPDAKFAVSYTPGPAAPAPVAPPPEPVTLGGVQMKTAPAPPPVPAAAPESGAIKYIGTGYGNNPAASMDELFQHPEGISVRAQRGILQDKLATLNAPLQNLIRSRFMLFALAKAGYQPAIQSVAGIAPARQKWLQDQIDSQVAQRAQDERLRAAGGGVG